MLAGVTVLLRPQTTLMVNGHLRDIGKDVLSGSRPRTGARTLARTQSAGHPGGASPRRFHGKV